MTGNEQLEVFFEEIGLPISEVEKAAIKSRNKYVHRGFIPKDNEFEVAVHNFRAYQTLFHRVMLKLLDYSGTYIDYSTHGHPERTIAEVLGGSVGA